jgi:hypothetical protein
VYEPIVSTYPLNEPPSSFHPLLSPDQEELPLPVFNARRASSSKLPSLRELKDPVEISVDTYSSSH